MCSLQVNVKKVNKSKLFASKYPAAAKCVTSLREAEAAITTLSISRWSIQIPNL